MSRRSRDSLAATCLSASDQRLFWGAARCARSLRSCPQSVYESGSAICPSTGLSLYLWVAWNIHGRSIFKRIFYKNHASGFCGLPDKKPQNNRSGARLPLTNDASRKMTHEHRQSCHQWYGRKKKEAIDRSTLDMK